MGTASVGFPQNPREFVRLPAFDLLVVAFACSSLRLVATVVQPTLEQFADMFGVIVNAEVTFDELGNSNGGPRASFEKP